MFDITIIKELLKVTFICVFSYLAYFKVNNIQRNNKHILIVIVQSVLLSCLNIVLIKHINPMLSLFVVIMLNSFLLRIIIKDEIKRYYVSYMFAVVIVYVIYLIATLIVGILLSALLKDSNYKSIWFSVPIISFAVVLFFTMFKIKRFKNGFNFLKDNNINNKILFFIFGILGAILLLFGLFKRNNTITEMFSIVIGTLIISSTMHGVIRDFITEHYKKHMHDRTIEMQKREIDENLSTIEHVKSENIRLATIIHKYNTRITALERSVAKALNSMSTEFASELSIILDETQDLSKELEKQTNRNANLPVTNIYGIDSMFQYMNDECINNGINFSLKITDNINYLVENVVAKEKLETLIGDHIKDAIIAINSGTPQYKSILCILGIVKDCYEFSVYDTGIDFEIDTLLKLGKEAVTTHKDNGGSGIGFMTTFETMKECGASLVIEEYDKKTTHYTKAVTIRFDGKNEYRIYSYRYKEIKKTCKDKRILIDKIE